MSVQTRFLRLGVLNDARDVANTLASVQVALFSNVITPSPDIVVGDLTLVTVAGMAAQELITPSAAFDPGDGKPVCDVPTDPFAATSSVGLPIDVQGWAILNNAGDEVIAVELLDAPVTINQVGDGVDVSAFIKWGA